MTEILMFHRVLPKKKININDAYFIRGTLVSQERLENVIIKYLKEGYTFKTICNLEKDLDLKQVALTFDDGYLDNYLYAKPILEKYKINATFYPIIGYCIEQTIAPLDYYYHYVNENIEERTKEDWVLGKQKKEFLNFSIKAQQAFIDKLFLNKPKTDVSYMSCAHLQALHRLGHEIGGHSYYHDIYTKLTETEVLADIQKTKKALSQIGVNIKSYAYTDGQYNSNVIEVLKKENIDYSCAIKSKQLEKDDNYELERQFVIEKASKSKELFGINLTVLELNSFLKQIELLKIEITFNFLKEFIFKILSKIPFQNFKMIERGFGHLPTEEQIKEDMLSLNGGTCATMNVFAAAVLDKLGFDVSLINGTMMKKNDHIALLLNFENNLYTIDLGDGQPYFEPIPVNNDIIREHPFRTYRTVNQLGNLRIDFLINGDWSTDVTLHLKRKTFKEIYKTLEQHYTELEFGPFWNGIRFAFYPNKKIIAIRDKVLIIQKSNSIEKIEITSEDHLAEVTSQYLPAFKAEIVKCFIKQNML